MPLELKIVGEHADLVGDDAVREYHQSGGTIGRALQNDWILPDSDRFISGRHATIDYRGGIYYLADTSSNGVYFNNELEPVGRSNPRRLFDGDHLRMGNFKIEVSIDTGESLVMPVLQKPSVAPDAEHFVDEDHAQSNLKLLDEEELTGDEEFQSAMFGNGDKKATKVEKVEVRQKSAEPETLEPIQKEAANDAPISVSAEDLFDSFLDGLGINRVELHPSINRPDMMLAAGKILREFVKGTTVLLAGRASLKNTFRLDQTTVLPRQNNRMKFSSSTNDRMLQLLTGDEDEYLGAAESIREVCRELISHQNALLEAMNSAFIEFADQFDPDELQASFERTMGSNGFSFTKDAKYWRSYRDMYPILTEKGGGRFAQMFSEEFVSAYEQKIAEYLRHHSDGTDAGIESANGEIDPGLLDTQRHEPQHVSVGSNVDKKDIVDSISETGATDIDQSFIDELNNTMNKEIYKAGKEA
jgi:type VI secretion system protein ImpI